MARSPESIERERRRSRSKPKLIGRASGDGGCKTGHPAFWSMRPAIELGVMPEGGGYPVGFVEHAAKLMGVDVGALVHLCAGSVSGGRLCIDIRPETTPDVIADVRWLPLRPGSVPAILVDPPYGEDYAEALWGLGKVYPTTAVLMRECAEVLAPGGLIGLLHQVVPVLPDTLDRVGTYGICTGPGYRMRAFTIARKTDQPLELFAT